VNVEKKCSVCNEFKSLVEFHFQASGFYGTHSWCRKCLSEDRYKKREEYRARSKRWYQDNKERIVEYNQIRKLDKYNLTEREFRELARNGCMSCGEMKDQLCVDHNYNTGKIRGILCHGCNLALGNLGENIEKILKLAHYLEDRSMENDINRTVKELDSRRDRTDEEKGNLGSFRKSDTREDS